MQKTKKTALWACVIVLACMLSYCIVSKVQQYNYIHSEYRTGAMSVQKDPSETFEVRELISEKTEERRCNAVPCSVLSRGGNTDALVRRRRTGA